MAKKDFKKTLNETSNLEDVTKSYFSEETLKKAEQKQEEVKADVKQKRKYTKLKTSENKNRVIHFRVTEKEYKELIKKAEQTNSKSISDYLSRLLRG